MARQFIGTHRISYSGGFLLPARLVDVLYKGPVLVRRREGGCRYASLEPADAAWMKRTNSHDLEADMLRGKLCLPKELRRYASLGGEFLAIGVGEVIEFWNRDAWESYTDEARRSGRLAELQARLPFAIVA